MVVADSDVAVIGSVDPSEDENGKAEVGGCVLGVRFRWAHPLEMRLKCVFIVLRFKRK